MATPKMAPLEGSLIAKKGAAAPAIVGAVRQPRIAVTVKLEPALYRELKQLGASRVPVQTTQEIMVAALTAYLRQVSPGD